MNLYKILDAAMQSTAKINCGECGEEIEISFICPDSEDDPSTFEEQCESCGYRNVGSVGISIWLSE